MTCHIDFPKLNDFGKAFKDAGFKFPKDDEDMIKVAPVMLGAEAQSRIFPTRCGRARFRACRRSGCASTTFFQVDGSQPQQFNTLTPAGSCPQVIPGADFASGLFSIFTAGNFGSDIAFWVDDDISVGGNNGAGGLGDALFEIRERRAVS